MLENGSSEAPAEMTSSSSFSYAQAAKGVSTPQKATEETSTLPVSTQQDAADARSDTSQPRESTGQERQKHQEPVTLAEKANGHTVGNNQHAEDPTSTKSYLQADEVEHAGENQTSVSSSQGGSPTLPMSQVNTNQSVQPRHEDDVFAAQNDSEPAWDKVSQETTTELSSNRNGGDGDDSKLSTCEHVQAPQFKEAPIPTVNIWQKRAMDAQARSKETKSSNVHAARGQATSQTVEGSKDYPRRKTENGSGLGKEASAKTQSPEGQTLLKGVRTPENPKASGNMAPPPPRGDATSWPTPSLAKEEDKKKVTDRGERNDKEKTPNRPHAKEKWEKVDYVPTAVFATPLPGPRRGGRLGSRGGREGSARGGHTPNGGISAADRSAGGPNSVLPSTNATPPNERNRGETNHARSGRADGRPRRSASAGPQGSREQQRGIDGSQDKRDEIGGRQSSNKVFRENRRVSVSTQVEPGQRPTNHYPADNRRASIVSNQQQDPFVSSDPPRSSFDRRGEGPIRPQEYGRETNGYNPARERREGRPERGRGGYRSKGPHNHGSFNANGSQPPNGHGFGPNKFQYPPDQRHSSQPYTGGSYGNGREPRHNRGPSRSHSITHPSGYRRFMDGGPPSSPHHLPPLQIGMANMYPYQPEHPGAMSAVPFHPYMDSMQLQGMVQMQMEYYFSLDNLCKDMFLRRNMDSQGFVFLHVLRNFNRIKQLTEDFELLKWVCARSSSMELRTGPDNIERVRKAQDWQQWVLVMEERDPTAQNDGPAEVQSPAFTQQGPVAWCGPFELPAGSVPNGPPTPGEKFTGNDNRAEPLSLDGAGPAAQVSDSQPTQTPLSAAVPDFKPSYQVFKNASYEPIEISRELEGSFSDDKIDSLSIIVRRPKNPTIKAYDSFHMLNQGGSDSDKGTEALSVQQVNDPVILHGHDEAKPANAKIEESRSLQDSSSETDTSSSHEFSDLADDPLLREIDSHSAFPIEWHKETSMHSENGPEDITRESYLGFRAKALQWREGVPDGQCHHDMAILYEFWSHFLISNLNFSMYDEFRIFALMDFTERDSGTGLKHLITFYYEWLLGPNIIPDRLARDFVDIVNTEVGRSDKPAFDALRAAWRNGAFNFKNRVKIDMVVTEELRAELAC